MQYWFLPLTHSWHIRRWAASLLRLLLAAVQWLFAKKLLWKCWMWNDVKKMWKHHSKISVSESLLINVVYRYEQLLLINLLSKNSQENRHLPSAYIPNYRLKTRLQEHSFLFYIMCLLFVTHFTPPVPFYTPSF